MSTKIKIDLNKISRREFRQFTQELEDAGENSFDRDKITAEMIARVVVQWPFDIEITPDNYLDLGMLDGRLVDDAFSDAMDNISQKK